MPRIACLMVPLFPLAARLRSDPELKGEALVVLEGQGNASRVVAATRVARLAGIRAGFTLTQARARLPKVIARLRDAECERAAQEALLDVAENFSPRLEDGGEGLAYLDADGLERHYPGESPELDLGRALMLDLEARAGLPVRVGVAASKLTSRLAAQQPSASSGAPPGSPVVIAAGEEVAFLAPLPLDRLVTQARTLTSLERWGLRTVGELAALPQAEVVSRLGTAGQDLQSLARGEDPKPLVPRQPPPAFREGLELEWPLVNIEPFLYVALAALERLSERMAGHGLACECLELVLDLEPDGHHERSITLPAPTRDVKTLIELLRLDLEGTPPGAPIISFTLTAHPDSPRPAQLSLFGPAALSPEKLATTLARLFALLGEDRVGSPRTVDAHRPERFALESYVPPAPPEVRREPRRGPGLLTVRVLRPPLAVEVIVDESDPSAIRPVELRTVVLEETAKRPRIEGRVSVASGPWGLEEGWWSGEPVERDYWDVELAGGGLYRIYHERVSGDWFVDGIYD